MNSKVFYGSLCDADLSVLPPAPEQTNHYEPISHADLINIVATQFKQQLDHEVEGSFACTHGGSRLALMMTFAPEVFGFDHRVIGQHALQIGLLHAYDRTAGIKFVIGLKVAVCTNLELFGEYIVSTRHSAGIHRKLPAMIESLPIYIKHAVTGHNGRLQAYMHHELQDSEAAHLILEAGRDNMINIRNVLPVYKRYLDTDCPWRAPNTLYHLMQSITYCQRLKETPTPYQANKLSTSHRRLWSFFDDYADYDEASAQSSSLPQHRPVNEQERSETSGA